MDVLHEAPSRSDFVLLSDHQSQTPASFYDGPTILYHQSSSCALKLSTRDLATAKAFESLASGAKIISNGRVNGHASDEHQNGEGNEEEEEQADGEVEIANVDVWVTSKYVKNPPWPQISNYRF